MKFLRLFVIAPIIGLSIIIIVVIQIDFWGKQKQLNTYKNLLIQCNKAKYCPGRIEALESLVKAQQSLEYYNFFEAYLLGVNLENANLINVNFESANLIGANLINANLESANLIGTNFESANLESDNLIGANFESANLKNANLIGANLESANLVGVKNLTFSQIKSAINWDKAFYKGEFDAAKDEWIVNQEANQQYIKELEQDTSSDTN